MVLMMIALVMMKISLIRMSIFVECIEFAITYCRCQNRRISGRGSRTVRQGRMVTGDKGHDVFSQVRALSMEVITYSCLINIDDMGSTRVDLPRDQGG